MTDPVGRACSDLAYKRRPRSVPSAIAKGGGINASIKQRSSDNK